MSLTMVLIAVLTGTVAPVDAARPADTPVDADRIAPVVIRMIPATTSAAQRYRTEVTCRTSIETGSLVGRHMACLTAKQWDYVDQAHRDEARKIMMDNMGRPPGG